MLTRNRMKIHYKLVERIKRSIADEGFNLRAALIVVYTDKHGRQIYTCSRSILENSSRAYVGYTRHDDLNTSSGELCLQSYITIGTIQRRSDDLMEP